ncbi:MAG: alpha/beta fold hydrolase, partial [Oleispira antarctica]|nr:alpha/beta fold hydrolase [Oleispira antarctica]MBQ0793295.1 alpha/beta fold hydrolase [Oleispira antarctica]
MKSSSEFFPVTLLKADVVGDLTDDVYLIKHGRDADPSVQIALSHIGLYGESSKGKQPIVLVHGSFTNRRFWLSAQGIGLARYLVEAGFDIWLMEMRGHGLSPRNRDYKDNSLEHYAVSDVPAVNEFVIEKTGLKPVWLGHSLGGVLISTAIAAGALPEIKVAAIALLGTQIVRRRWFLQIPLVTSLGKFWFTLKPEMDGRKLKIGPENEPAGIAKEYLRWLGLLGQWRFNNNKTPLLAKWQGVSIPLLAMVGKDDQSDPAKYCQRFYES